MHLLLVRKHRLQNIYYIFPQTIHYFRVRSPPGAVAPQRWPAASEAAAAAPSASGRCIRVKSYEPSTRMETATPACKQWRRRLPMAILLHPVVKVRLEAGWGGVKSSRHRGMSRVRRC